MANDTQANGSQFFISLVDLAGRLDIFYTIFGQVISGTDVVDAIGEVPVNDPQIGRPAGAGHDRVDRHFERRRARPIGQLTLATDRNRFAM